MIIARGRARRSCSTASRATPPSRRSTSTNGGASPGGGPPASRSVTRATVASSAGIASPSFSANCLSAETTCNRGLGSSSATGTARPADGTIACVGVAGSSPTAGVASETRAGPSGSPPRFFSSKIRSASSSTACVSSLRWPTMSPGKTEMSSIGFRSSSAKWKVPLVQVTRSYTVRSICCCTAVYIASAESAPMVTRICPSERRGVSRSWSRRA